MPLADEFLQFTKSRGFNEFGELMGRVFKPSASVLQKMGPSAARMADDLRMIEDDTAKGVGEYLSRTMPLETWERVSPEKRIQASHILSGFLSPDDQARALADPEIDGMVSSMRNLFSLTNEQNLQAVDNLGNPLQVRNPFTGEMRAYEGISENYFPRFVKRSKRDAILDPMNYAQAELERSLGKRMLNDLGLDSDALLSSEQQEQITKSASEAIDDFFRTGEPNSLIQDKALIDTLTPAYQTFQELHQHMRAMAVSWAKKEGREVPPEMDPIVQLFGSDDPTSQRHGIRMLRDFLLRDAQNARRFGSIESSRAMPLPRNWYEDDPLRVVPLYVLRQQRRLAEIRRFGQDNEAVLDPKSGFLAQIVDEGDREFAKTVFNRAMGLEPYNRSLKMNNVLDWAYASQVLKLGTAQISQLGQIMNVIMETGLGPTWQALSNMAKSKEIAQASGASLTRVMDIVREGLADPLAESKPRKFIEGFLTWTGFNKADLIARHIGAGAGYAHGQNLLRRVIENPGDVKSIKELRRLIPGARKNNERFVPVLEKIATARQSLAGKVTPDAIEGMFREELEGIARNASLNANFRNSILDMPLWSSSPLGRLVSMFRSFAYKQTVFMYNRALSDYKAGNPRTLLGLAAAGGLLGEMISALKAIPQGRFAENTRGREEALASPEKAALRAVENIATVGGLGLFDATLRAMRRGDIGWFEFIAGPLFTDIVKFVGATGEITAGATGLGQPEQTLSGARKLGKFVGSHIPVVGGGVSQGIRTALEPVERHPSGAVTRGKKQVLGKEEPPIQFMGMTLPSLSVLFGLEESAYAQRERYLGDLKKAVAKADREEIVRVLRDAQSKGIRISAQSLNRLLTEVHASASAPPGEGLRNP